MGVMSFQNDPEGRIHASRPIRKTGLRGARRWAIGDVEKMAPGGSRSGHGALATCQVLCQMLEGEMNKTSAYGDAVW